MLASPSHGHRRRDAGDPARGELQQRVGRDRLWEDEVWRACGRVAGQRANVFARTRWSATLALPVVIGRYTCNDVPVVLPPGRTVTLASAIPGDISRHSAESRERTLDGTHVSTPAWVGVNACRAAQGVFAQASVTGQSFTVMLGNCSRSTDQRPQPNGRRRAAMLGQPLSD